MATRFALAATVRGLNVRLLHSAARRATSGRNSSHRRRLASSPTLVFDPRTDMQKINALPIFLMFLHITTYGLPLNRDPSRITKLIEPGRIPVVSVESLRDELASAQASDDIEWFYLGTKNGFHFFAGIFWEEPSGAIIDNEEFVGIAHRFLPVHKVVSIAKEEINIRKKIRFTINSKRWKKFDDLAEL